MKNPFKRFGSTAADIQDASPPLAARPSLPPGVIQVSPEFPRALGSIVTHAWKAQQRLRPSQPDVEPTEEQRRLLRHIEAILDAAKEIGITVKDRTGEIFDYGLPEKVVASEPQIGLAKPVVKETIRPTVSWNEHILVHGEVVLATPAEQPADAVLPTESSSVPTIESPPTT